jgi:hypothetical protein
MHKSKLSVICKCMKICLKSSAKYQLPEITIDVKQSNTKMQSFKDFNYEK